MNWYLTLAVLVSLATLGGALFFFKMHTKHTLNLLKIDIQKANSQSITPLKLQAYERIALLTERTSLPALIKEYASTVTSARAFTQIAINAINEEYKYNVSQQIYVSEQLWTLVKVTKEQHSQLLNQLLQNLPEHATSTDMSKELIQWLQQQDQQPQDKVLHFLKKEIALYFS
ncbi:MAG: hypothetical protein RLZZ252_899 [Bacteroidota bacterium]|jgi:predicted nucleic acid-binding protein